MVWAPFSGANFPKEYFNELVLGLIPGAEAGFLVGINRNINNADETFVADQGGLNLDLPGNTQLYLSSDSASDTNVSVAVSNLDEDYNPANLTGTTNGQVQVPLSAATSFKTEVVIVVGLPTPVGNLYLAEADTLTNGKPDDPAKIRAIIPLSMTEAGVLTGTGTPYASDNISHLGIKTVPAKKQMLIYVIIVGTNKNDNIKVQGRVRFEGGPWLNRNPIPLYQSNVPVEFKVPLLFPEKTDLQFMATGGSEDSSAQVLAIYEIRDAV